MKNPLLELLSGLGILVGGLFFGIIFIAVIVPLFILVSPFTFLRDKIFARKYRKYLSTALEGKNFFCYNNRRKSLEFITWEILPLLPPGVEPLYLEGYYLKTDYYEEKYLSKVLYQLEHYQRFPHLIKIRNGQVIDCQINNEVFNCLNQGKPKETVIRKMEEFFELQSSSENP
ncbi:MAG: hypothetical protein H6581_25630 [Bacteroidia bacterium]|nr:hypothetical protein [Bacteroidia bacterium]